MTTTTLERPTVPGRRDITALRPKPCQECAAYFRARAHVIGPHLSRLALERGLSPLAVTSRYATAVHRRHVAGHTLDTTQETR